MIFVSLSAQHTVGSQLTPAQWNNYGDHCMKVVSLSSSQSRLFSWVGDLPASFKPSSPSISFKQTSLLRTQMRVLWLIYMTPLVHLNYYHLPMPFAQIPRNFQSVLTARTLSGSLLRLAILKVWFLDFGHQHQVGICYKCKFSGRTPDLLNEKFWCRAKELEYYKALQVILRCTKV